MKAAKWLGLFVVVLVATGCHEDCGCCIEQNAPAPMKSIVAPEKPAQTSPAVSGTWVGRWESIGHKGHGGGLKCEAVEDGPQKWSATFTAEFGKTKSYQVKLQGKPGDGAVLFGGAVDLGKSDGGMFTWSGKATASEFSGTYDGGGDTGTFSMKRTSSK